MVWLASLGNDHSRTWRNLWVFISPHFRGKYQRPDLSKKARLRFIQVAIWISNAFNVAQNQAFYHLNFWIRENKLHGLTHLGSDKSTLAEIAIASHESSSMKGNPVLLSSKDLEKI